MSLKLNLDNILKDHIIDLIMLYANKITEIFNIEEDTKITMYM